MSFDANAGAVGNHPVFVGAFVDAFHSFSFGFSFQRLAAGLSPIVVGEWSTNGPRREIALWLVLMLLHNQLIFSAINSGRNVGQPGLEPGTDGL